MQVADKFPNLTPQSVPAKRCGRVRSLWKGARGLRGALAVFDRPSQILNHTLDK
jgi:hypothetical protein